MRTSARRLSVLLASVCVSGAVHASGGELSRATPDSYTKALRKLVTPAEKALSSAEKVDTRRDDGEDVVVVLYETISSVRDDGSGVTLVHRIVRATTDAGAASIGTDTFGFRRVDHTVHLPLARTIQPDGTSVVVQPDAAFVQTPQRLAVQGLFTDRAEVSIVFPQVKAGSAVEALLVVEQQSGRIAGEYTRFLPLAHPWPSDRLRHVVELPQAYAERLIATAVGNVTAVKRETLKHGRVRLSWNETGGDGLTLEPQRAPLPQTGPGVWLTTLAGWDDFAAWYRGLLTGRLELPRELASIVDAWTEEAATAEEVVRILHRRVADDVRYTGLEFGIASFQPKTPSEVWDNQYGDCKDKANLLRAFLAHKGLRSYLALLNTDHVGTIERRSPDYRQFDHAILAIEDEEGGYVWSDPTIPHLPPGRLGPEDADRDALVILDDGHEIVRTPVESAGRVDVSFDLELRTDGSLSGWILHESDGFLAAVYRDYFGGLDELQTTQSLGSYVTSFFEGAEVIDHELLPRENPGDPELRLRAYFATQGGYVAGNGGEQLRLPHGQILPRYDSDAPRETDFYQRRLSTRLRFRYRLPENWAVQELPKPFEASEPGLVIRGGWEAPESGIVTAELLVDQTDNVVPPSRFDRLAQTTRSFYSWMDRPLHAREVEGLERDPSAPEGSLVLSDEAFPRMPTAEGQIRLIESRYPADGNRELRRAALERALQRFPEDPWLVFSARIRLADLDCDQGRMEGAATIRALISEYRDEVEAENIGWARFLLAQCPGIDPGDSTRMLLQLGRDENLSPFRRGWSYYQAAESAGATSVPEALRILDEAKGVAEDLALVFVFTLETWLAAESGPEPLDETIGDILTHEQAPRILAQLSQDVLEESAGGDRERAAAIAAAIVKQVDDRPELAAAVAEIVELTRRSSAYDEIASRLAEYVRSQPPAWWNGVPVGSPLPDRTAFAERVARAMESESAESYLRHVIELLTSYPPDPSFASDLGDAARVADYFFPEAPLSAGLVELTIALPEGDQDRLEGLILRGDRLRRTGRADEALAVLQGVDPERLTVSYRLAFRQRMARAMEALGRYDEALDLYDSLVERRPESLLAYDGFLRAAYLRLAVGEYDEALRMASYLSELVPEDVVECDLPSQTEAFAALAAEPDHAREYWTDQETWWPQWMNLERKLGIEPLGDRRLVPELRDLEQIGTQLGLAAQAGDRKTFFEIWRTLIHTARWQPSIVIEVGGVSSLANDLAPQEAAEIRRFLIDLYRSVRLRDADLRSRSRVLLAGLLIQEEEFSEVEDIVRSSLPEYPEDDVLRARLVTLWGIAASQTSSALAEVGTHLEATLRHRTIPQDLRTLTVLALAEIYRLQERRDEEIRLLAEEVGGGLPDDNPRAAMLRARLDHLRGTPSAANGFDQAFARWSSAHRPAWFDFARPESLDGVPNVNAVLEGRDDSWSEPERAKIAWLTAGDPQRPASIRSAAFLRTMTWLSNLATHRSASRELLTAAVDDEGFGPTVRDAVLMQLLIEAMSQRDTQLFRWGREHPIVSAWPTSRTEDVESLQSMLAIPFDKPGAMAKLLKNLAQEPLSPVRVAILMDGFYRIATLGTAKEARAVYDAAAELRLIPPDPEKAKQMRFRMLRLLDTVRELRPMLEAMREVVRARTDPASYVQPPGVGRDLAKMEFAGLLQPETATPILLHDLVFGRVPVEEASMWPLRLARAMDPSDGSADLTLAVALAAIRAAPNDRARFLQIMVSIDAVGLHDEERLPKLLAGIAPYRDPKSSPECYQAIRVIELENRLRRGEQVDLDSELAGISGGFLAPLKDGVRIGHYLAFDQVEPLARVLKAIPVGRLIGTPFSASYLMGLERAGMTAEAELVRESVEDQLYDAILESWATPTWSTIHKVFRLAGILGESSKPYPDEWLAHILDVVEDDHVELIVRMDDAELKERWLETLAHAEELLERVPLYKELHWHAGQAAYQIGDWNKARIRLEQFIECCREDSDRPQALAYLEDVERRLREDGNGSDEAP